MTGDDGLGLARYAGDAEERDAEATRAAHAGWPSSSPSTGSASSSTCCCTARCGRGSPPDHILLSGSPGLGKTTLAMIVAAELGAGLRMTSGPAIERSGDLAAILTSLAARRRAVHRRDPPHRQAGRGAALQRDGGLPGRRGRRQGARAPPRSRSTSSRSRWSAPPPGPGLLTGPMRDRFGFVGAPRLLRAGRAGRRCCTARPASSACRSPTRAPPRSPAGRGARPASPTGCCAGCATTPRCAPTAWSTLETARAALQVYDVDELGLDRLDQAVLTRAGRLVRRRPGRAVHARRRGGGAAGHGRGGVRAVPGAGRPAGPYAARAGWPPTAALAASGPHTAERHVRRGVLARRPICSRRALRTEQCS